MELFLGFRQKSRNYFSDFSKCDIFATEFQALSSYVELYVSPHRQNACGVEK